MVCLQKPVDLISLKYILRDWTHPMQHAIPHQGFYVIKLHDLKQSFTTNLVGQRQKLWKEFFLDPSQQ
jgi:hypothetical protein